MKMIPKMRGSWRSSMTSFHITNQMRLMICRSRLSCPLPRESLGGQREHQRRIHRKRRELGPEGRQVCALEHDRAESDDEVARGNDERDGLDRRGHARDG